MLFFLLIYKSVASLSDCWWSKRRWRPTQNGWSRLLIGASFNSAPTAAGPPSLCATRSASSSSYGWLLAVGYCVSWPHRPLPDSVSCRATFKFHKKNRVSNSLIVFFLSISETFHLMRIMVDDYFLYLVELLHVDDRARELMRNITLDIPPEYLDTDYEGAHYIYLSICLWLLDCPGH